MNKSSLWSKHESVNLGRQFLAMLLLGFILSTLFSACTTPAEAGKAFFYQNQEDTDFANAGEQASSTDSKQVHGLADPGLAGNFAVSELRYASEYNPRRPEYQSKFIDLTSKTMDISMFVKDVKKSHWGFNEQAVPLNAIVYFPKLAPTEASAEGFKGFPLIVHVHGNHDPYEASELGYAYLGQHLASRGFVFVSVDENFLNRNSDGEENDARAILLLEHAKLLLSYSKQEGNPLQRLIDASKIFVSGHSRGGEAAYMATVLNSLDLYPDNGNVELDYKLNIIGAILLAPSEGQYRPQQRKVPGPANTSYLSIHGGHDGDVPDHMGEIFIRRNQPSAQRFNAALWIYGANHAQFNSTWARAQDPGPTFRSLLLSEEEQQDVAKTVITAFVEQVAGIQTGYEDVFRSLRKYRSWLPITDYAMIYRNGADYVIADFEEDHLLQTATHPLWRLNAEQTELWGERELILAPPALFAPFIGGLRPISDFLSKQDYSLNLTWTEQQKPTFTVIRLNQSNPEDQAAFSKPEAVPEVSAVQFELGALSLGADKLDFVIELTTEDGTIYTKRVSDTYRIQAIPSTWLLPFASQKQALQTIYLPFTTFSGPEGQASPEKLKVKQLRFLFDQGAAANVLIDRIALSTRVPQASLTSAPVSVTAQNPQGVQP